MPKRSHDGTEVTPGDTDLPVTHREHFRKWMNPHDANVFGTVHGGQILTLMEETGAALATKYCNQAQNSDEASASNHPEKSHPQVVAVLARVARTDFIAAMHVGEIADAHAQVLFTSPHSLEVSVTVYAENIFKGTRRLTNKARLWYVPLSLGDDGDHVVMVPPLPSSQTEGASHATYLRAKEERLTRALARSADRTVGTQEHSDPSVPQTVPYSRTQLTCLVGPADVTTDGICRAGVLLHLIDECAGVVAAKHCATKIATVSFDAINFRHRIKKGGVLTATGWATFTSRRSLEIHVSLREEKIFNGEYASREVADGFVTYVSLGEAGKAQEIPPLRLQTANEREASEAGQRRYDNYKEARSNMNSKATKDGRVSR